MKKMFFTAIALVAFSSVSMASTFEEKKETKKEDDKIILKATCSEIWGRTRIWASNQGYSLDESTCMAWAAFKACVGQEVMAELENGMPC
ncbi:MAG: hypothetical protein K2P85_06520 [Flavobacteriaceae bacterium]|nr:hypothetical protein [Flavobacteriaceae bacterium]